MQGSRSDAVRRAVFLDRDGVINREMFRNGHAQAPSTVAEVEILPGVPDALEQLRRAGFLLIVVTNQPDVVRGSASRHEIETIHSHLRQTLPVDDIRVCYHDDVDGCACRKPSPGMLYAAAVERDIALAASYRWETGGATSGRDAERAARRFSCTRIVTSRPRSSPMSAWAISARRSRGFWRTRGELYEGH